MSYPWWVLLVRSFQPPLRYARRLLTVLATLPGWETQGGSTGDGTVCGTSLDCGGFLGYGGARDYCEANGGRLCTYSEAFDYEATATGCQYDAELVWTQTRCTADDDTAGSAFWAVFGSPGAGSAECTPATSLTPAVRCCADTANCNPTPVPAPEPSAAPTVSFSPTATFAPSATPTAWDFKCRYVFIQLGGAATVLNVAEVEAFGVGGVALTPVGGTLSSTLAPYSADLAIDGSRDTFCSSSGEEGGSDWLELDLGGRFVVTAVTVTNRADHTDRIVGATLGLFTHSGGAGQSCGSWAFGEAADAYTFESANPTAAPVFPPTPLPSSPFPTPVPTVKVTNPDAIVRYNYNGLVVHSFMVLPPAKFFRLRIKEIADGDWTFSGTLQLLEVTAFGSQAAYPGWDSVQGWNAAAGSEIAWVSQASVSSEFDEYDDFYDYCVARCDAVQACKSLVFWDIWYATGCSLRTGCVDDGSDDFPDSDDEVAALEASSTYSNVQTWYRTESGCVDGVISSPTKVPVPNPSFSPLPSPVPTHSYAPSTTPAPTPVPTLSTAPSIVPSPAPTTTCVPIIISATSAGSSSIAVTHEDGSSTGFSMSQGRGLNVAVFSGTSHSLLSTATYDTYGSSTAQTSLIAALSTLREGSIVVMVANDEASNALTAASRASIADLIPALLLSELTGWGRYGLIAVKGAATPKDEAIAASTGSVAVSGTLGCYLDPSPQPSAAPTSTPAPSFPPSVSNRPTAQPTPSPTLSFAPSSSPSVSIAPTATQPAHTCSRSTCDELEAASAETGWSSGGHGADEVCGSSLGCSGLLDYAAAKQFCQAAGARLCTYDEVRDGEVSGTGCSYDINTIWTQTPCDAGDDGDAFTTTKGSEKLLQR